MIVDVLTLGMFQVNCIILADEQTREGVVIDPGEEPGKIIARIRELDLTICKILLTHCHLDHAGGAGEVKKATGAELYFHDLEQELYDNLPQQAAAFATEAVAGPPRDGSLAEGDVVEVGSVKLEVLHTPGHSPGGVALLARDDKLVVVGDTLFASSIGRSDLWGGDFKTLIQSIRDRLLTLDPDTRVLPGHGPETTIGREAKFNPFLTSRSFL